jgi:hypothetical protein
MTALANGDEEGHQSRREVAEDGLNGFVEFGSKLAVILEYPVP